METRILVEELSPLCNVQAIAEADGSCVYFYLIENPGAHESHVRSCWVRNYGEAPASLDVVLMKEGQAPPLPAEFCAHPSGADRLDPAELSIVWFEEGDAAALLCREAILCVIPGWADDQCPGYACDCTKPSPLAWPLGTPDENMLLARVQKAQEFWASWSRDPWPKIQEGLVGAVTAALGPQTKYYAIDGGEWPPKALVRIDQADITYLVTIGVSIPSQPKAEQNSEFPEAVRRIEMAMAISTGQFLKNERGILSYSSAQTRLPWSHLTWLGHGHTIPCNQMPSDFPYVLLLKAPPGAPAIALGTYRGDPVNLLWMIPITAAEQRYAAEQGSAELLAQASGPRRWVYDGTPKFTAQKGLFTRIQQWRPW